MQRLIASSLAALLAAGTLPNPAIAAGSGSGDTATPIKHLVVIFGENISFDHYFGAYPYAANPEGEPHFKAKPRSPCWPDAIAAHREKMHTPAVIRPTILPVLAYCKFITPHSNMG